MQRSTAARVGALAALAASALLPAAAAAQSRRPVPNAASSWARTAHSLGPAQGTVHARVYLQPRGGMDALEQDAVAVSTPGAAAYHRFLTPAQFRARYEPTASTVAAVRAWLHGAGMRVDGVEASGRYVSVSGSPAAAARAFGTRIERYHHKGQLVRAPAGEVTAPADVAGDVLGVTGLDSTKYRVHHSDQQPPAFVNARPCSAYYGQVTARWQADFATPLPPFQGRYRPYAVCGYTPSQFRSAYEGGTSLTGQGVRVGIIDAYASPSILRNANTYATRHGDAPFAPGQFTQTLPANFGYRGLCDYTGWYGEETLDVEAVHGMAQDAGVHYYAAPSCLDEQMTDTLDKLLDDNDVDMVSNSYGDLGEDVPAGIVAAFEQAAAQAAMQGIGLYFSSGDNGDEVATTGTKQADFSASSPLVTAVGGTSTAIGADGSLLWQTGWGTEKYSLSDNGQSWEPDGFLYGAGGGYSRLFNRPSYQNNVVKGTDPGRAVPDVAMDADPTTGMLVGETQEFPDGNRYGEYRIGGTSLAAPLFTGMTALAEQHAGARVGFINPLIYHWGRTGEPTFQDVLPVHTGDGNVRPDYVNGVDASDGIVYSVRTFDQDSSLNVTPGWDDVTGLGVPTPRYLVRLHP